MSFEIIEQSFEILNWPDNANKLIEIAGRTCYKSEDRITDDSADKFCKMIKNRGHLSVIEHASATVRFITDRGITHELVRHRLLSVSQESTRYVNYNKRPMRFIAPSGMLQSAYERWLDHMNTLAIGYKEMIELGEKPEIARSILPNSLAAEIVITANFREWRHIFKLRCDKAAHRQMRELMIPCRDEFKRRSPAIFGDL
jgi:thymidylate synthase (FAD)